MSDRHLALEGPDETYTYTYHAHRSAQFEIGKATDFSFIGNINVYLI